MDLESNKNHLIYRLRSLDKLLGDDFRELERQTIYFSPFSELNDPMEGISDMVWFGDSVVWENLFRHYLLCMEYKVSWATMYKPEESEKFFKHDFPILISEANLPTDLYRQHFGVIKERFFSYEPITTFIEYLGERKLPIRKNQLSAVLSLISNFALKSILFGYNEFGFGLQPFWKHLNEFIINSTHVNEIMDFIKSLKSIPDEKANVSLMNINKTIQEANLITQTKLGESIKRINWFYFYTSFLQEYLEQLPQLVYPNWYSASFMNMFPENSVLWGHYGDSHKGVCLIFRTFTDENQQNPYLMLRYPKENEDGYSQPSQFQLKNIVYSDEKEAEIEFFAKLWTQSAYIVANEWYHNRIGQESSFINQINPTQEERLAYWDRLNRIQNTKTKSWEYENECRIAIDNSFYNYTQSQNRTLKYDFKELEGIIFGIKTPAYEKAKIIKIITEKCKEHKRSDFKFYQAKYSDKQNIIIAEELSLLKLKV